MSRYVYKNLITEYGKNPYIYHDETAFYALVTVDSQESQWIDLYISFDEGESWILDESLPVDIYKLDDAKIITNGDNKYIFAHGINEYNVDTIRLIKYEIYKDDVYAWDDDWSDLFDRYAYDARVTDLQLTGDKTRIIIAYDKMRTSGKYGSFLAIYNIPTHEIVYNESIDKSNYEQHNAKILLHDNTLSILYERINQYNKGTIQYSELNFISLLYENYMQLSKNDYHSYYHPSFVRDSASGINICWLVTKDNYDTCFIEYTNIINNLQGDVVTLQESSRNDKYPCMICDEYDNLYILYNRVPVNLGTALSTDTYNDMSIHYMIKPYNSLTWSDIDDVIVNNQSIISGWCNQGNIYSLSVELGEIFFLRIDTQITETLSPITDFQIADINNTSISFKWTKTRNAEKIVLQELDEDNYKEATLIKDLERDETWTKVVNLTPGIYKFQLRWVTSSGDVYSKIIQDSVYITTNEYTLRWQLENDVIEQKIFYTIETWSDTNLDIPITADTCTYNYKYMTRFRLNVTGGLGEGTSNEIAPLQIYYDDVIHLNWVIPNITYIELQESLDGISWFKCKADQVLSPGTKSCTISNTYNTSYFYRLKYIYNDNVLYSNIVNVINNVLLVNQSYNYAIIHFCDVEENETKIFEYSDDHGTSWNQKLFPISQNTAAITNLDYDSDYYIRICYLNRFTGRYSNIIKMHTNKKPISDLKLDNLFGLTVKLSFTISDEFDDVLIKTKCQDYERYYNLLELDNVIDDIVVNGQVVGKNVAFFIPDLLKGTFYEFTVEPQNSHRGGESNIVTLQTTGDNITTLDVEPGDHSVTLNFGKLDRITPENVSEYLILNYSSDGVNYIQTPVTTTESFTLNNLNQDTEYYFYLTCNYGDNYGISNIVNCITNSSNYEPLTGTRMPGERSFCAVNGNIYVMDKNTLYEVSGGESHILKQFDVQGRRTYNSIATDGSNYYIVIAGDRHLYYISSENLDDMIELVYNPLANECSYPVIKISKDNKKHIVYQNNYGSYSDITYIRYGDDIEYNVIVSSGKYGVMDLTLKNPSDRGFNGFFIAVTGMEYCTIIEQIITNNKDSDDYKNISYQTDIIPVENILFAEKHIYIESDNLDTPRISCPVLNGYMYIYKSEEEYQQLQFNVDIMQIIPNQELIASIYSENKFCTSKYNNIKDTFTDLMYVSEDIDVPDFYYDNDNIYVLSFKNGELYINLVSYADIKDNNNYVNNNWIANVNSLMEGENTFTIWTDGNVNDYPKVFLMINDLVSDITDLFNMQSITITALELSDNILKIHAGDIIEFDINTRTKLNWEED